MDLLARAGVWLLGALAASPAAAGTFVADFSSPAQFDASSSTAVWDAVGQRVRAADVVNGTAINYGTGADGDFDDGAPQLGIAKATGSTVSLDTNRGDYNFTSFNLSPGTTLTATGSKPLVIRVLNSATIAGTIDLSGHSGTDNSQNGPAPGGAAGVAGGTGGNGGFGVSGSDTQATSGGSSSGSQSFGGLAGTNGGFNQDQGGGGGCNGVGGPGSDATHGFDNSVSGGTGAPGSCSVSRSVVASDFIDSDFTGGGGGGGGGGFNGAQTASGSGGGGAGGALHFVALGAIGVGAGTGVIQANGGAGGNQVYTSLDTTDCGGAGGGGSGGSIWLQTPGSLATSSAKATINVNAGNGGNDFCGLANGGIGSTGVARVDATSVNTNVNPTSQFTPSTSALTTYIATSKSFDTGSSAVAYQTPQETFDITSTGCGTNGSIAVAYEGSNDNVNFSGDVPGDQISILDGYRYIRFKVTIKTGSTTTPAPCLTALSIPYGSTQFALKGGLACGSLSAIRSSSKDRQGPDLGGLSDLALLGIAATAAVGPLRTRRRRTARRSA